MSHTPKPSRPKVCLTCLEHKPGMAYSSSKSRRCIACADAAERQRVKLHLCYRCEKPKALRDFPHPNSKCCSDCKAKEVPGRTCRTCAKVKSPGAFAAPTARRCRACARRLTAQPCKNCGQPAGLGARGAPRTYCATDACQEAKIAHMVARQVARRAEIMAARVSKRCPGCLEEKPLSGEHWSPGSGTSPGREWDSYCKPCRAGVEADRRRTNERHRAAELERQRRRHQMIRERRAADPEFNERMLEQQRQWEAARRERRRNQESPVRKYNRASGPPGAHHGPGPFPRLPAGPLHLAIAKAGRSHPDGIGPFCQNLGIDERSWRAWDPDTGDRSSVQFDIADKALTALDLMWFDVWADGPDYVIARKAFEGDMEAVA